MDCENAERAVGEAKWSPIAASEPDCWVYRWQLKVQDLKLIGTKCLAAASKKKCRAAITEGALEKRPVLLSEDSEIRDDAEWSPSPPKKRICKQEAGLSSELSDDNSDHEEEPAEEDQEGGGGGEQGAACTSRPQPRTRSSRNVSRPGGLPSDRPVDV
jgi:hypothetical protein